MAAPALLLGASLNGTQHSRELPSVNLCGHRNAKAHSERSYPRGAAVIRMASSAAMGTLGRFALERGAANGISTSDRNNIRSRRAYTKQDARLPETVEDLQHVIAANTPVFHLHHDEKYFPCTVEFFLQHARLCTMHNTRLMKRVIAQELVPYGHLDENSLLHAYKENEQQRLQLHLQEHMRSGQPDQLPDIPVYAHVRETVDNSGQRDAIEIVYCKFFAFNGPYKPFGIIPSKTLGTHDSDWEHVTVRLTPDGREVTGVYYSCHRHIDGTWRSADEVPRTESGRPRAYVAVNGHGSYPFPGRIIRLFGIFNDNTSADGEMWDPSSVVIVSPAGMLPSVRSRGDSLNGTAYPSTRSTPSDKSPTNSNEWSPSPPIQEIRTVLQPNPPWLQYGGKWGSTVVAPALQEWFAGAENPVSRTWLQTVFFPLVPGVESLLEPLVEEAEDLQHYVSDQIDDLQISAEKGSEDALRQLEAYKERVQEFLEDMLKHTTGTHSETTTDKTTDDDPVRSTEAKHKRDK